MHIDRQISVLGLLGAAALAIALMAAPLYLPDLPRWVLALLFWGGLIVAVPLIGVAIWVAFHDEALKRREGRKRRMPALIGMIVFGVGFLGCVAWYFWPVVKEESLIQLRNVGGDPPHFKAELRINSTKDEDALFFVNITNIGTRQIHELRVGMKSDAVFDYEPEPNRSREVPPGGTITVPGIPRNGLAKTRELLVFLSYKTNEGTFSSQYKFQFRNITLYGNDVFHPTEWAEINGDILAEKSQGVIESGFAGAVGTLFFNFPEIRPDTHKKNNITLFNDGKKLIVDMENRTASFWVKTKSGKEWTVENKIPAKSDHKLAVAWDEGGIALSIDGTLATAGRDASPALNAPGIGTLQYANAGIELDHKISTNEVAGQFEITIHNTNPFLIRFHAQMFGQINGISSPRGQITFDGIAYPSTDVIVRYDRLSGIQIPEQASIADPSIIGEITYKLEYWADGNDSIKRTTGKRIRIQLWEPPFNNTPTTTRIPAKVSFETEIEE